MSAQAPTKPVKQNRNPASLANLRPPWEKGKAPEGAGRPLGSRHKLSETFLRNLLDTWERKGPEALERLADESPALFVRVVAEVAVPHLKAGAASDPQGPNAGAVFDAASFLAGAFVGRAQAGSHAPALPDRPVLAAEVRTEPAGYGEAVDSGSLPRGRK